LKGIRCREWVLNQKSAISHFSAGSSLLMRYLVRARVKPGREAELLRAIEDETLGRGSVAEGEYLRNMQEARLCADQTARWVEVCYCPTPLQEERPYWEKYFELARVQDAHDRRKCRDENGTEPWACGDCDCTARLERKLKESGAGFLQSLQQSISSSSADGSLANSFPAEGPAAASFPVTDSSDSRQK
jgi:hypothetical protein